MGSSECGFRIADFGLFILHSAFCIPQLKGHLNPRPLEPLHYQRHNGFLCMQSVLGLIEDDTIL